MQNVARGVGLGGSATLIFAFMMAAPAVAEVKINVPAIHVDAPSSPSVGHPTTPSFKTVVPPNSKGRPSSVKAFELNSQKGGGSTTGEVLPIAFDRSSPVHSDPSLRFTLASLEKPHRNQLDDDPPTAPPEPDPTAGVPTVVVWVLGPAMAAGSAHAIGVINSYPGGIVGIITDISHGFP